MADVKISGLPAATTPLAGTEVLPIVQSTTTKKVSIADVTAGRAVSASSLTATNLKTSPATANLDISGTTIAASGSDANVDVNINAKGSGVAYLNQRWGVNQSGALVASSGNTYDIGNGTNNPRDVNIDRYAVMNGLTASKAVFTDASKNLTTTGTVEVTQGGTGTSTAFTAGSVVFAGASGVYSQDNAKFFWDNSNDRLGVGTATPANILDVTGTARPQVKVSYNGTSGIFFSDATTASYKSWQISSSDITANALQFTPSTANGGTTFTTPTVSFHASGGVGIGTNTDPGAGSLTVNTNVGIRTGSPARSLHIASSPDAGPLIVYSNAVNGTTNSSIEIGGSSTVNGVATGASAAAHILTVNKDSGSTRSINAAGSVNANGADYAEYMTKCGDFVINKGDICGIDKDGLLTNQYADAVTFVVKSTNPSYVGNDDWFLERCPDKPTLVENATDEEKAFYENELAQWKIKHAEWKQKGETARVRVDRVAFSGQVPVNVLNATPGQYILPVEKNGGIVGMSISNPTFEQYRQAVGRVIAVEPDGRAKIIVIIH